MSISQMLERWLASLAASTVTEAFLWATAAVFVVALNQGYKGRHSQFLEYAPTLMTSLGILGTFVGVVIGLLHFDTQHIDAGIPLLLEGLKTAFITSIVGMFAAGVYNTLDAWKFAPKRAANGVKSDISPRDIYEQLESQSALLTKLTTSIAGAEEGSLVGQIKLLRGDIGDHSNKASNWQRDFSDRLWKELATFSEMLSKSATSQIIEALQEVIRDFNNNLVETFGENFKALDASVKKMVEWQERYRDQVDKMSEQYQQSVTSLVATKDAVAGIWGECKEIPLAMERLKEVLVVNQHQIQELQRHLEAFKNMRDAALIAVPTIQRKVEEIGDQMLKGANEMRVALDDGAVQFRDSIKVTNASVGEMANVVKNSSESISKTLKDTSQEVTNTSRDLLARMNDAAREMQQSITRSNQELEQHSKAVSNHMAQVVSQMVQTVQQQVAQATSGLDSHMRNAVDKTGGTINKQLEQLEMATAREIERAMNEMGQSLVKITSRFVSDYQKMVDGMNKVIRLHEAGGR